MKSIKCCPNFPDIIEVDWESYFMILDNLSLIIFRSEEIDFLEDVYECIVDIYSKAEPRQLDLTT